MIILKGPPSSQPYQFTCKDCSAELEAEYTDVKSWVDDPQDGDAALIDCPCCQHENWIAEKLLPNWRLQTRIKKK